MCDNYGGITLLSVSSIVFFKIISIRIQRGVEKSKEKNKLALGREEALLNNYLPYITSLNIVENGTHIFTSTLQILRKHSIQSTEKVYD